MLSCAKALRSALAWALSYMRPLRQAVAERGLVASAPFTLAFLTLCLVASALWAGPPDAHHLAATCCAYHGWPGWVGKGGWLVGGSGATGWLAAPTRLAWSGGLGDLVRMVGSAFLLRHPFEVAWAIVASVLVLAPLEVDLGSRRLAGVAAFGHLVPTIAVALSGLSQVRRLGGGGLDVGASAVIVAAAAALAYRTRSPFVTAWLVGAQLVDLALDTPLAGAEHLIALLTGAATAWALSAARATRQAPAWGWGPSRGAARVVRARPRERKGERVPRSVSSGPSREGPAPP